MPTRVLETDVCIIGGGPAGMVLGLLLARAGVAVEVVERRDAATQERGADLIGPATRGVLDHVLGVEAARALAGTPVTAVDLVVDGLRLHLDGSAHGDGRPVSVARRDLLAALIRTGATIPSFSLRSGAHATGLRRAGGAVTGATVRDRAGDLEIRARVTVGADGRGSIVRAAAGLVLRPIAGPVDVVWADVPAREGTFELAQVGSRQIAVGAVREGGARLGLLLDSGGAARLQQAGIEAAVTALSAAAPSARRALAALRSWRELGVETLDVSRVEEWHRPGLLLIGEAAHPMSPLLGAGTDLAVQDAVAAANRITEPLLDGRPTTTGLAAVGRRRAAAAEAVQSLQLTLHAGLAGLASRRSLHSPPTPLERAGLRVVLPALRSVVPRLLQRGVRPEEVARVAAHSAHTSGSQRSHT